MSKFYSRKVVVDGITFDSKKEARRFKQLKALEEAGKICNLNRQVKFTLIPTQREPDIIGPRGGVKKGKLLERELAYYADFCYLHDGKWVVEDVKGLRTKDYIIKRKLVLYLHGIRIKEV